MELWDLKNAILQNNIPNLLIFVGEETKVKQIYVDKIAEISGSDIRPIENFQDIISEMLNKTIVKRDSELILIKEDSDILTNETSWQFLNSSTPIILSYNKLDNKPFIKQFESHIVKFDRLGKPEIKAAITNQLTKLKINLKPELIDWLIDACKNDYNRVLMELDKLLIFKDETNIDFNNLFKTFAKDNLFHYDVEDNVFEFSNAVIDRDIKEVFYIYADLKQISNSLELITILYQAFRRLALIQNAQGMSAEQLGLSIGQFNALKYKATRYTKEEVLNNLILLADTDSNIKRGLIDANIAIDYLLTRLL